MHAAFLRLAAAALLAGLSCSLVPSGPPTAALRTLSANGTLPRAPQAALHGPTATDWVEAQLRGFQTRLAPSELRAVARAIVEEPQRYAVDRDLVLAVIRIESGFNSFAESHAGALGLMQIMPQTGKELAAELGLEWRGPEMLFDPTLNVRMGTAYLAFLFERYGSWNRALAAYNWGPAAIDRRLHRGRALPRRYVAQVLGVLQSPAVP